MNISSIVAQVKNCTFEEQQNDGSCLTTLPQVASNEATLKIILQTALGIIAAVTLIFMILAALKMVTSQGDSAGVAKARQSVIFAAIGLTVVLAAEAIVTLVIKVS